MNRSQIALAGGAIALMIGATAALSKPSQNFDSSSALAIQSSSMLTVPSLGSPPPVPQLNSSPASPLSPPVPTNSNRQIGICGTNRNANFRAYPSLDPRFILGVVAHGDTVRLTGRKIQDDGVEWYEAIAPNLYPSLDAQAQNKLDASQTGWIASCFLTKRN